ncbi:MAG: hypothetical protein VZS44_06820 [Bacilli bacterium]|nr:hypothetical protein [Bacilli bacterium]
MGKNKVKKRNNLYNVLDYILDIYCDGKVDNRVYFISSIDKKHNFGCSCPVMLIRDMGNYFEIVFTGNFGNFTFRTIDYTIRVNKDDEVVHDISSPNNLLEKIINYIEGDLYKGALELDSNRKADRIKEENKRKMNPNIVRYTEMVKEILFGLGTVDWQNSSYYDSFQKCVYNGYGLSIASYYLPNYKFENEYNGCLTDDIKDYMNSISISYKDRLVFDTEMNIYNKGIWEQILIELYDKLPILKLQKDNRFKVNLHGRELVDDVINPLLYRGVNKIDDLEIHNYGKKTDRINNCGSYEDDYHYSVIKNGKEVFHIIYNDKRDYSVYKYIPGEWENRLRNYLVDYDIWKKQKDEEDGLEFIRQLKNK